MPQSTIKHNFYLIALSLIIVCLIFISACLNDSARRISPVAVKGVLDLTDWDFKKHGPVNLSGEYEFYWSQHLLPSDFTKAIAPQKTRFIGVPAYWKNQTFDGKKLHSMEEGYYEVDLAGNLTFFNDSLRRHMGYLKR